MTHTNLTRLAAGPPARRNLTTDHRPPTTAFTLVEMLVVITIIGILVSLSSIAVFKALEAAHKARIKSEITNLESAVQAYKQKYGDFPPSYISSGDTNSVAAVTRHLAKAFPRCTPATEIAVMPANMSGAEALVFWLTSISKDPARPLSALTTDRQSFFDFDKSRLVTNPSGGIPGWQVTTGATPTAVYTSSVYLPQSGKTSPYYYFDARSYLFHALGTSPATTLPIPYLAEPWDTNANNVLDANAPSGTNKYDVTTDGSQNLIPASLTTYQKLCANPKSFQIISAGLDGDYGTVNATTAASTPPTIKYNGTTYKIYFKSYPSGVGYDTSGADNDNITNFSESPLGDAIP